MHHCPHQENRCCLSKLCGSQLLDAQESQSCQVCESGKASSLTHGLGTFQSLQPWSLAQDNAFRLQMKESVTVQEGLCILVPCSVFYPRRGWIDSDPAQGYWFRNESNILSDAPVATNDAGRKVQEETKGRFHLVGDPRDYNCSLDIRDARMADKGSYFFRIVRGSYVLYNFKQNQLYMHVTALTQTPNIHIQGTLESGHPTSITCKVPWACKRGMPPTFFWIGVAVTSLGSKTSNSSELTFTPEPHHHGTNLTCRVNFPGAGVATESTIQLNVSRSLAQDNAFRLQMNKSVTVQEGLCILVPCSVFYPRRGWIDSDPARGYWFRNESNYFSDAPVATNDAGRKVREETKGRFHLVGDPRDYNCSLDIRDARMADKGSYFFRIVRGSYVLYNFNHYQLYVHVTGEPRTWSGIAQGASWGAGITALLTLSFCLIFFTVKIYKKKRAEAAASMDDVHPVLGTSPQGHLNESWSSSPSDYPSSEAAAPTLSDEQELHYASVSFQGPRPWNSQGQEVTNTTEYSEIKIRK
ncbi:sialic acid-binding Ig-like lectin 12 isoform X9 [Loxodonta africana]|uniref:sialic acid-binding Ig-like lectin 12 isoform X9 n=1 Tax=Loxodonta africana TaxID=9785 RepID=UPI0030CD6F74